MTGADEQELRGRLDTALMTITPRPAPIDAVIRQGSRVRTRRRIGVAGLAVIAACVIGLPAWLGPHTGPQPVTHAPAVTVVPPGPGSPAGLIASGTVGTKHWSAIARRDAKGQGICVQGQGGPLECGIGPSALLPVDFVGVGNIGFSLNVGPVQQNITRVTVSLANGQLLVLHPQRVRGGRYVAFAVPTGLDVLRATAFAGRTETGYSVPFNSAHGPVVGPVFLTWLRPGETGHPQDTFKIGSGKVGGQSWSVSEYAGLWGRCFTGPDNGSQECVPGFRPELRPGKLVSMFVGEQPSQNAPGGYLGTTAARVDRVTVTLSNGQVINPVVVSGAEGEKFFAFRIGSGLDRALRWTAYGAGGQKLGSGKVTV